MVFEVSDSRQAAVIEWQADVRLVKEQSGIVLDASNSGLGRLWDFDVSGRAAALSHCKTGADSQSGIRRLWPDNQRDTQIYI